MDIETETRVPSPEMKIAEQEIARAQEAAAANLPTASAGPAMFQAVHAAAKNFGEVVAAVAAVMADLQPVYKGGENTFHHYKYARMQDILQMLTPLMGKHGLAIFQYEADRNMFDDDKVIAITYRFVVAHKSGQTWIEPVPQTGMSPCRTSKGTFDDKAFAKCHTSARKYFLLSLFQIPTEDEADPDNEKRARNNNAPVPSPDGHMAPHLIEPTQRDTFDAWADRYLAGLRTSKTLAEADAWDLANDEPLATMDGSEKGRPVLQRILREFEAIRERLYRTHNGTHKSEPEKASPAQSVESTQAFQRPKGCPDPDKDPDGFVTWARKRMDSIGNPDELTLVWENEITASSDGLFKPDCDALEEYYNTRLVKIEG